MTKDWRERALSEIHSIKSRWAQRYGWAPEVEQNEDAIDLYISFPKQDSAERFVLRLRYCSDFETAGRREAFVNPDDYTQEGEEFWPNGNAFKRNQNPPAICLEGTWGFHSNLHTDRDGRTAQLNKLLLEVQQCIDQ